MARSAVATLMDVMDCTLALGTARLISASTAATSRAVVELERVDQGAGGAERPLGRSGERRGEEHVGRNTVDVILHDLDC